MILRQPHVNEAHGVSLPNRVPRRGAVFPAHGNALRCYVTVHRGLSQFSRRVGRYLEKVLDRRKNGTVPLAPRFAPPGRGTGKSCVTTRALPRAGPSVRANAATPTLLFVKILPRPPEAGRAEPVARKRNKTGRCMRPLPLRPHPTPLPQREGRIILPWTFANRSPLPLGEGQGVRAS